MLVSYPFTIRKDNLETKTHEEGSFDAMMSELSMFLDHEEGELEHIPDYGVSKRQILFSSDLDEAGLGILMFNWQEKIAKWFDGLEIVDIIVSPDTDLNSKRRRLILYLRHNGEEREMEVEMDER